MATTKTVTAQRQAYFDLLRAQYAATWLRETLYSGAASDAAIRKAYTSLQLAMSSVPAALKATAVHEPADVDRDKKLDELIGKYAAAIVQAAFKARDAEPVPGRYLDEDAKAAYVALSGFVMSLGAPYFTDAQIDEAMLNADAFNFCWPSASVSKEELAPYIRAGVRKLLGQQPAK